MAQTAERESYRRGLQPRRTSWLAAAAVSALLAGGSVADAGGLPLRSGGLVADPALTGLAEGLHFKLEKLKGSQAGQIGPWQSSVEDTLLIAQRLGFPAQVPVIAQRIDNTYIILLRGEGYIAGADPDQVLGRLLYTLAHSEGASAEAVSALALSILDQPLSVTVATLASYAP